jgi:hypothetical protein
MKQEYGCLPKPGLEHVFAKWEKMKMSKRSDRLLKNGLLVELFGGRSQEQVVQLLNLLQHLRMRCLVLETLLGG